MSRYRVGCAGMFVLGTDWGTDDLNVAFAGCRQPPGCDVIDMETGEWIGPVSMEEIEEAEAALVAEASEAKT